MKGQATLSELSNVEPRDPPDVSAKTYRATLHDPLFYGSKEGSVIDTEPYISATALMHAIGYTYAGLRKDHVLLGDDTTQPTYERLRRLPFFTSDARPVQVDASERTFRTVSYGTERTVTLPTQPKGAGMVLHGKDTPFPRQNDGSNAGWHRMRDYVGLGPGSEFEFVIWSVDEGTIPDEFRIKAGIKLTGHLTAVQSEPAESVALNQYLLDDVYGIDSDQASALMSHTETYQRGNDRRTNRFLGVDAEWATEELVPELLR